MIKDVIIHDISCSKKNYNAQIQLSSNSNKCLTANSSKSENLGVLFYVESGANKGCKAGRDSNG